MSQPIGADDMSSETFGKLVKAFREQRGWTQSELAARWGFTREYVSQIERDKRKVERAEQVASLAQILDIPPERLDAIGRGIPRLQSQGVQLEGTLQEADNLLLQTLLEQAQTRIKLSWLVWYADSNPTIVQDLTQLLPKLEEAIANRRGTLLKPSLQMLAYAHEMMGKIAFDKLDYAKAGGHFHEMNELGDELNDPDIIAMAMIHQGDLLRRRGRYDLSIRCLQAAEKHANAGTISTQGLRWQTLARVEAEYQHKDPFYAAIDKAQEAATQVEQTLDTTILQFNEIEVIQERAQGHTLLWEPQKALPLYDEAERLKPFRPMRDLGVFIILKAQAYAYSGEIDEGIKFALKGLQLARGYQSERHISRVQRMYDRLSVTPLGKSSRMKSLQEALSHK